MKLTKLEPKFLKKHNPRIGLITLASDFRIEKDFNNIIFGKDIDLYSNRIKSYNPLTNETLKKMAMINYPVWGWFDISNREDPLSSSLKKINSILRTTPSIEQGIYFTKDLYFSIGGVGAFKDNYFSEISKRLYSRLDPQPPLLPLTYRGSSKVSLL